MANKLIELGKRFRKEAWAQSQVIEPNPLNEGLSLIDTPSFLRMDTELNWLIKQILVEGQPAIMGGVKKTLKTTLLIALAVAMASGRNFLGRFTVPSPLRVGLISGEAGAATIKETFLRICKAMVIHEPKKLGLWWGFHLPQLSVRGQLKVLTELIKENGLQVVGLDPLYLCLLAGGTDLQASNLYQIGPLLADVSQACLEAGATPILAHHNRMDRSPTYQPPELGDLAFAGIQEFARQWLLLGRRKKYESGTGEHNLWLNVGGSAGFSGCWALDIEEGVVSDEFTGRRWQVAVSSATETRHATQEQKEKEREAEKQQEVARDCTEVTKVLQRHPHGETYTTLNEATPISKKRVRIALDQMLEAGKVVECEITKPAGRGTHTQAAYRLVVSPKDDDTVESESKVDVDA